MLQFLETGKALYVLAAVCILSLLGKFITRNLYKRLIKETDNMALTKNKYLRALKQKAENTYRVNQGVSNTAVYVERQLYDYHFMGASLNAWNNSANQMTLLCFLLGGIGSFASYWFRCDSYYVVMYGATGILMGLLSIVLDSGFNLAEKKQQLTISLQDYLDNSLFGRMGRERGIGVPGESEVVEAVRNSREIREKREAVKEAVKAEPEEEAAIAAVATKRSGNRGSRKESAKVEEVTVNRRETDYLKRSLEQIAVSREKSRIDENWLQDLKPEEVKLIGEILKEYLS